MKKRLFSLVLAFLMLMQIPAEAFAEDCGSNESVEETEVICAEEPISEAPAMLMAPVSATPIPCNHEWWLMYTDGQTCTSGGTEHWECIYCGNSYTRPGSTPLGHEYKYSYEPYDAYFHTTTKTCIRGDDESSYTEAHEFVGNTCSKCGYVRYPDASLVTLSVSAYGNGANSGTGYVELSWNEVPEATFYYVCVFNGAGMTI